MFSLITCSAASDVFISSDCKPGFSSSFSNPRCIECPSNWYKNFLLILIASVVGGVIIVIFMLALNLTVAIGTLNGILFYTNIVAAKLMLTLIFCHSQLQILSLY